MNGFERSAGGFLAFFRDAQGAIVKDAALAAFRFDNAVASGAGGGGIEAKHTDAGIFRSHRQSVYGERTACANNFVESFTEDCAFGLVFGTRVLKLGAGRDTRSETSLNSL